MAYEMTKEKIKILMRVNKDTADMLLDTNERSLYFRMRNDLVELFRSGAIKSLSLPQLQFIFHKKATWHYELYGN